MKERTTNTYGILALDLEMVVGTCIVLGRLHDSHAAVGLASLVVWITVTAAAPAQHRLFGRARAQAPRWLIVSTRLRHLVSFYSRPVSIRFLN